jgi:Bacterial extracellular solute-binding protein
LSWGRQELQRHVRRRPARIEHRRTATEIDYLDLARDRWEELHVDCPEPNMWNEHPYYILDVPWSDARQRAAAAEFLKFLMSEPIQKQALEHGFRPGNPAVSVRFPDSRLLRHAKNGRSHRSGSSQIWALRLPLKRLLVLILAFVRPGFQQQRHQGS